MTSHRVSHRLLHRFSVSCPHRSFATSPSRPPLLSTNTYPSIISAIGNTALIKLQRASALTGCEIWGKAEFQNPAGSVKDRAALYIIKDAEERGLLVHGEQGLIVEGTAGNTGIGLTAVGNARGYKTVICIADTQSREKKDTLRWGGATLIEVPAVPFKDPNNYVHVAQRLAQQLSKEQRVIYANQWDNLANRRAHIETTGPEIWAQLNGRIDAFSCATGTGGTLSGVGEFLRSKNPNIKICLTDPCGAALYRYYTTGELKAQGDSISEGIGQGRITGNMKDFKPDWVFEVPDAEAFPHLYDLLEYEGLALGSSSAINIGGAISVAKKLGPGHTIVTMLCDLGSRYASKIYNPQFLRSRNLPVPHWLDDSRTNNMEWQHKLRDMVEKAKVPKPSS